MLQGKRGLVLGIANNQSIAYGCAKAYKAARAELAVTYLNEKAKRFVQPLAEELSADLFPCDVTVPGQLEAVFEAIGNRWGSLDFVLHSMAFAPLADLHGRVTDCSLAGFQQMMDVSVHSLIRVASLAEPLMIDGGSIDTLTYIGSQKYVENYNCMGIAKAALEATVKYLAAELGPNGIRVHAISSGPIQTRAASGIKDFSNILDETARKEPLAGALTIDAVGSLATFLASDGASAITGNIAYCDAGRHVVA